MKTTMTVLLTLLVLILVGALLLAAVSTLGLVNVAATADHLPGAEWFLSTLSESSIRKQTAKAMDQGRITPPPDITQAMLDNGRHHYVEMCVVCHGAPGVDRGEIGSGLKPEPPELSHAAREMSMEEIYWVIENGIRHTGMPAYGGTHSPDEMWGIAAFVEELETMSAEEYERQTTKAEPEESSGEPSDDGGDGHEGHSH